jgi:hypothetical protein
MPILIRNLIFGAGAFYGMGDFMSGVSDSSSNDSRFMLRIGMQRSDHY